MKTYSEKYSNADRLYQFKVSKELLEKRRSLMDDFGKFRRISAKRAAEQHARRVELRGIDTEKAAHDEEIIEQTVQFLVESKKEELPE